MSKTVPLSVRISHEDAEFLAGIGVDNAKTPSDKVRAIISQHRRQSLVGKPSYVQVLSWLEEILDPVSLKLREVQNQEKKHSELIHIVLEWLPNLMAYLLTAGKVANDGKSITILESELSDKIFRLIESILRLGVTEESPCIDKAVISNRMRTIIDLVEVIQGRQKREKGE